MNALRLAPLLLLPTLALAQPSPASLQKQLDSDAGWEVLKLDAKDGVDVYKKKIEGVEILAFKGEKVMDVDGGALFDAIVAFDTHVGLSDDIPLTHSVVLGREGNTVDFYQYLDVPGWTLANDRFWFARATIKRDWGGAGHHRQSWERIEAELYPAQLAAALKVDEDAVLTPMNVGSWEVVPLADGRCKLIYRVLSDPGGKLPKSVQALATGRTLPDNLLQFEAAARKATGR